MFARVLLILALFVFAGSSASSEVAVPEADKFLTNVTAVSPIAALHATPINSDYHSLTKPINFRRGASKQSRFLDGKVGITLFRVKNLHKHFRNKSFDDNFPFCSPIGLKLVFPQHYFW